MKRAIDQACGAGRWSWRGIMAGIACEALGHAKGYEKTNGAALREEMRGIFQSTMEAQDLRSATGSGNAGAEPEAAATPRRRL